MSESTNDLTARARSWRYDPHAVRSPRAHAQRLITELADALDAAAERETALTAERDKARQYVETVTTRAEHLLDVTERRISELEQERDEALAALNGLDEVRAKYGLDGADVAGVVRHLEGNRDFVHGTDAFTIRLLTEQRDAALAREAALREALVRMVEAHENGPRPQSVSTQVAARAHARAVLAEEARDE